MTNLISKYFKKILLINAILTTYNTLHSDVNTNIHIYVNDIEIREEGTIKLNGETTYSGRNIHLNKEATINVEATNGIKKIICDKINAIYTGGDRKGERINSDLYNKIKPEDLVFIAATKSEFGDDIIKVSKSNTIKVENDTICFHYLTKRRIEAIKNLKIETVTINDEETDIKKYIQNLKFLGNIDMINDYTIESKILENIEKSKGYKDNIKKQGVNNYKGNIVKLIGQQNNTTENIIKNAENATFSGISINLYRNYRETYNVKYKNPEGTEFRDNKVENGNHKFTEDGFGESYAEFPTKIYCSYKNKEEAQKNRKKEIAKTLKNTFYSEYETDEYKFNKLDKEIYKKEEEFLKKINNGDTLTLPVGKNWNTLQPNDTIKVELSEKSEFIKSIIVPVKINPPEGHQLAGILGVNNTVNVTISGINDINNKNAIKNALKTKLSAMRIDVNGKRLEIPQDTIETITSNIHIVKSGLTETCEGQIPIEAGDFIATEQEIKQREQEKQDKNKKLNKFGMSEGTARCCACCGKCCKGECCKVGCCEGNNNGG